MEELEQERAAAEQAEREKRERMEKIKQEFDVGAMQQYEKDKEAMREAVRRMKEVRGRSHPEEREREERREAAQEERERKKEAEKTEGEGVGSEA